MDAGIIDRHGAVEVGVTSEGKGWSRSAAAADRLSALLRSHAARSADCGGECPNSPQAPSPPGTPRGRRAPRESRRVSVAQAQGYVQLNQYRLLEPIGQGSYGIVKLAYNEEDDTHYAMKILSKRKLVRRAGLFGRMPPPRRASAPPPPPGDLPTAPSAPSAADTNSEPPVSPSDPLHRVYREIAVLKKLDHPNVVKLIEVLDDPAEDQLYLVFQLLEGGPVLEVPTDRPLQEKVARDYFRDVLLGVEYLHYQRIVHRDLKPANLLLAADGGGWRVQVADLGVCDEVRDHRARLSGAAGTPAFRAPESFCSAADSFDGKAADIWSLGVTLFALVTGGVPWTDGGGGVAALQRAVLHTPLRFPRTPRLSQPLRHLIARMLDKDAATRIKMPEIKAHPWVTRDGAEPLPSEHENCHLVEVTEEDLARVVTSIPNLSTLILIKTMLKNHSFQNPFLRSREGSSARSNDSQDSARTPRPALSRSGRSVSAPGSYLTDGRTSFDIALEAVQEREAGESERTERGESTETTPATVERSASTQTDAMATSKTAAETTHDDERSKR